jgi:hypothetical protein
MSTVATSVPSNDAGPQRELMEMAKVGDKLDAAALAPLRAYLNDQIAALNKDLETATTQDVIDQIQAEQNRLGAKATGLTGLSILLTVGEAKVTALHIRSAVDAARKVIDKIASIKSKLAKLGAVIDFAAAVLTGNGRTIVEGAEALKAALETAD